MFGKKMTSLKRIGAFLAAAALTVGLAFIPAMSRQVLASDMPDMKGPYTLTVNPGDSAAKDKDVKVVAYIYKVADFDGETFEFKAYDLYKNADVDGKTFQAMLDDGANLSNGTKNGDKKDTWKMLDIAAGNVVVDNALVGKSVVINDSSNNIHAGTFDLDEPGLYLIIACDKDKDIKKCTVKNSENPKEPLVTAAYTDDNTYYWVPELILVPNNEGEPAVTGTGKWVNDISVTLKPAVVPVKVPPTTESESVPPTTQPSTKTPPKPTPKTGDDTNLSRMLIMAGVSIVVLVMLGIYAVKRRKDQNK